MDNVKNNNSVLMRINPIIKGLGALILILSFSFLVKNWIIGINLNLFLILLCFFTKLDAIKIIASVRKILVLLIFVGIFSGYSNGSFAPFIAILSVLRILGVFLTANIYITISPQSELLYFWELCFKPLGLLGIPSRDLALTMVIAIRFLPVLAGELDRIKMAQIARGAKLRKGLIARVVYFMPLLIPMLTQAIMRAEELADAMEVRGYRGNMPRGRYKVYGFSYIDFISLSVLTLLVVILLWKLKFIVF